MSREWLLDDLLAMFPDVSRGTRRVLRCLWKTSGQGRYVREREGNMVNASVSLTAQPSLEFRLRLTNEWPKEVSGPDARTLESELLRGILEGTIACEDPPWLCRIDCTAVDLTQATADSALHIRIAAALAVRDLVEGGGWEATGGPGDHVA